MLFVLQQSLAILCGLENTIIQCNEICLPRKYRVIPNLARMTSFYEFYQIVQLRRSSEKDYGEIVFFQR